MLINANSLHIPLADESVHCVITSPPYWGLRDYGLAPTLWGGDGDCRHRWAMKTRKGKTGGNNSPKLRVKGSDNFQTTPDSQNAYCAECGAWHGCLGLEPTPEQHVANIVTVFREVWRVLRADGTLWLNYGDCYATQSNGRSASETKAIGKDDRTFRDKPFSTVSRQSFRRDKASINPPGMKHKSGVGLKPKDLVGMPWRVALALQADGWYLRSDIIWHKTNPMPESVADRPTKAHEYIFLLSKNEHYFYDAEAIKTPASHSTHARISQDLMNQVGSFRANGGGKTNGPMKAVIAGSTRKLAEAGSMIKSNESFEIALSMPVLSVNKRTVWSIATQSYSGAHFATFPEKLIEPMVLAGTSLNVCAECGAPHERITEKGDQISTGGASRKHLKVMDSPGASSTMHSGKWLARNTTGFVTTCAHHAPAIPATVLDPFAGTGTVGRVAARHGRRFVGLELNLDYIALAQDRTDRIQMVMQA